MPTELIQKLEKLLHHWSEHNQTHAAEYKKWAQSAKAAGLGDVGSAIENAGVSVQSPNRYLQQALDLLQKYKKRIE